MLRCSLLNWHTSVTSSQGHSNATSSGFTTVNSEAKGEGESEKETRAHFESNVTCFGKTFKDLDGFLFVWVLLIKLSFNSLFYSYNRSKCCDTR